ncbi:dihydrolipoyllysine-residue succinyltransferase [Buchnera aphidicola (Mindarus keteleerifoliae)]|uniref:dihydrolipoyllysine-residue succinyltransferase n=1 Tax=Buchnera aphidicola TaxID=9 RepID=UPI0031B6E340
MKKIDILVPDLPESIITATVASWHKKTGDVILKDEIIVDIETDKVILEIPSSSEGILSKIFEKEGSTVSSKQILGEIIKNKNKNKKIKEKDLSIIPESKKHFSPSLRRILSYKKNSTLKSQNISYLAKKNDSLKQESNYFKDKKDEKTFNLNEKKINFDKRERFITRKKMSPLRKCIAERLLYSKNSTAMLTTFNEVNMKSVIKFRKKNTDFFKKKHGIKLGLMSFFVKSIVECLKSFPSINTSIEDDNLVLFNYFDINIAVSTERGLITPVLKDANKMSISEIEKKIKYFSEQGNKGKLDISDLENGTFTITNGGVFGSLLSTPIINFPQAAILGMHAIKNRPVVINNEIKIAPMMYLALSYDHRIIDGKESINFLNHLKKMLENISTLFLEL